MPGVPGAPTSAGPSRAPTMPSAAMPCARQWTASAVATRADRDRAEQAERRGDEVVELGGDDQRREQAGDARRRGGQRRLRAAAVLVQAHAEAEQRQRRQPGHRRARLLADPAARDGDREQEHDPDQHRQRHRPTPAPGRRAGPPALPLRSAASGTRSARLGWWRCSGRSDPPLAWRRCETRATRSWARWRRAWDAERPTPGPSGRGGTGAERRGGGPPAPPRGASSAPRPLFQCLHALLGDHHDSTSRIRPLLTDGRQASTLSTDGQQAC